MAPSTARKPSYVPTRDELVKAAQDLVPVLRERAVEAEQLRRMPDETIKDLKAAGIHKIFMPLRYGGFEMDWGTHVDVSAALGAGCGSTAWVASVVFCHTWMLGRFPPEAQEEFWSDRPDAIIGTAFAGGGKIIEQEGGYIISGQWRFASGIDHSDCAIVGAAVGDYDPTKGGRPIFRLALLMPDQYEIIDTWFSEGLRATGSKDIKVVEQFIPTHRTILSEDMNQREPPGAKLHQSYIYNVEFPPYFNTLLIGPILGTARGALEEYVTITKDRTGAMFGESIVDQIPVQIRVGESYMELRAAELITKDILTYLHETGAAGKELVGTTRLNIIRDFAYVARLCLGATDRLSGMMGVTGQTGHNPVQRHFRDCRTMSTHGALQWDKSMFPTGRMLFGIKTGDPLVDREMENGK